MLYLSKFKAKIAHFVFARKHCKKKKKKKGENAGCIIFCDDLHGILHYTFALTHSHTMTPFDAPGKQAF